MAIQPDACTILIVDDMPSNLSMAVELLEAQGYHIAIAQDGQEALQRAALVLPGLILLDVMLPGVDGFEVCRRLKAQDATRDIPVIFMTALASTESKVRGFEAGGVDYVTKPLQMDELAARVGTHLKLRMTLRQLAQQNIQLEKNRVELEDRVAQRTAELFESMRKLDAGEQAIRAVVENSPDSIARYDSELRRIYVNPATQKLFGLQLEQILGTTPDELQSVPEDFVRMLRSVFETGRELQAELPFLRASGSTGWGDLRMVPEFGADGDVVSVLSIGRDISQRKKMERRLEESQTLLRQLAARNEDAREDERRHLKLEVHDELGQYLSALRLGLSVVDIQLDKLGSPLRENTRRLIDMVDATIQVVRNIVAALRPSALDLGIASALEWLAQEHFERTGTPCELQVYESELSMDDRSATAIFRVVQESLTNILRHANATQIEISLALTGGDYLLLVRDNGQGFDPLVHKEGCFGLIGIRERALMLGGNVAISSGPQWTEIRVQFPARA